MPDRFHLARANWDQHPACDMSLGNGIGFDHADPRLRRQFGKVFGGRADFFLGSFRLESDHRTGGLVFGFRTLARATFEIGKLLDDVSDGQSRQAGIFRTSLTIGQMAVAAREDVGGTAGRYDLWHGGMVRRMPVW